MKGAASDAGPQGPFRGPERLALAIPLTSAIGLTLVVTAAATGQPMPVVALLAVSGFCVNALASIALLEFYLGRPLRAALAHLRAARDGLEAPGAPPPGMIGDLVAVARDIAARRADADLLRGALTQWERRTVAGDAAIRALHLQTEQLAATAVRSDSELRWTTQSQFAEISEALTALKGAASTDGATERVEQMLVYLSDAARRRDAGDMQAGEALGRIERTLTETLRLIAHETQALHEAVSSAALTVRDDIAATVADDNAAQSRQFERVEALEARVLAGLDALSRARSAPETFEREAAALVERIAHHTQAQASRLDEIEANVARKIVEGAQGESRAQVTLTRTTEKLRNAIDRLDTLSASAASVIATQNDDLKAALRTLEREVAGLGGGVAAQTETILVRLDADAVAWEDHANALTLAVSVEAQTLAALRADIGTVKARVAEIAPRVAAATESLAQRLVQRLGGLNREAA